MNLFPWLATLPLIIFHFNLVSWCSILLQLLITPFFAILIPLLVVGLFIFLVLPDMAVLIWKLAGYSLQWLTEGLGIVAAQPWSHSYVTTPTNWELLFLYGGVALGAYFLAKKRWKGILILLIVGGLGWSVNRAVWNHVRAQREGLSVQFLNVRHGDAIVIELPKGKLMVLDGGGGSFRWDCGAQIVAPYLFRKKYRTIDYLVLSHPDKDHLNGLLFLAKTFKIGEVWLAHHHDDAALFYKFLHILEERKIPIRRIQASDKITLDDVDLDVFNPPQKSQSTNNDSMVFRLNYGKSSFLFTGDIEKKTEGKILSKLSPIMVLKVPHHGSRTSNSEVFLKKVSPRLAIGSSDNRGRFNHPHPTVRRHFCQCSPYP